MPKETAGQRKAREKAERLALAQANERQESEIDEDKARQLVELSEKLERQEMMLEYYEKLVQPKSKLMILYSVYEELRQKMQTEGACSAQRVSRMQAEVYAMQKHHSALQEELVHIRSENKKMASQVASETQILRDEVAYRLEECIDSIHGSILKQREDTSEAAAHLNTVLEKAKMQHIQLAKECYAEAHNVTALQQEHTSMHTRIPGRIRGVLHLLDKDDLLLILDTLSFEDSALQYLLYRYPPPSDNPFEIQGE